MNFMIGRDELPSLPTRTMFLTCISMGMHGSDKRHNSLMTPTTTRHLCMNLYNEYSHTNPQSANLIQIYRSKKLAQLFPCDILMY